MIEHSHPFLGTKESDAMTKVLHGGRLAQGTEVAAFEEEFAAGVGTSHAVAVSNGTTALEIGLQAAGIGPGDEVVVPAFTFMATANAVRRVGAMPVFADIDGNGRPARRSPNQGGDGGAPLWASGGHGWLRCVVGRVQHPGVRGLRPRTWSRQ